LVIISFFYSKIINFYLITGEVAVKWVEAINIGLPMCYGGAIFGAMRLRPKQRELYKRHYLPWAVKVGREMKPLLPVFWEKRWTQNINEIREELNIRTLEIPKN
jgi:ubiquinone biosynthesis protein COQ4